MTHVYIFVEWMLSVWFWRGLSLLSSMLTFLVSSPSLNPLPSWWGILVRDAVFGIRHTWVQVLVLNPSWASFLLCEMEVCWLWGLKWTSHLAMLAELPGLFPSKGFYMQKCEAPSCILFICLVSDTVWNCFVASFNWLHWSNGQETRRYQKAVDQELC